MDGVENTVDVYFHHFCSQSQPLWDHSGAVCKCTYIADCVRGLTAPDGGPTYYLWRDSNVHRDLVYTTKAVLSYSTYNFPFFTDIKVKEQSMENLMR